MKTRLSRAPMIRTLAAPADKARAAPTGTAMSSVQVRRMRAIPGTAAAQMAGSAWTVVVKTAGGGTLLIRRRTGQAPNRCPLRRYEVLRIDRAGRNAQFPP